MGDHLLQRGTIYGAHRMSGGTIHDDTSGPGYSCCAKGNNGGILEGSLAQPLCFRLQFYQAFAFCVVYIVVLGDHLCRGTS